MKRQPSWNASIFGCEIDQAQGSSHGPSRNVPTSVHLTADANSTPRRYRHLNGTKLRCVCRLDQSLSRAPRRNADVLYWAARPATPFASAGRNRGMSHGGGGSLSIAETLRSGTVPGMSSPVLRSSASGASGIFGGARKVEVRGFTYTRNVFWVGHRVTEKPRTHVAFDLSIVAKRDCRVFQEGRVHQDQLVGRVCLI